MSGDALTPAERTCLARLAQQADAQQVCAQDVLEALVRRGLVEKRPLLNLPVVPPRTSYHLTAAGRAALATSQ